MPDLPLWSVSLCNYYVVIRLDGRNKTIRRRYYRKVEVEKLRLAELGVYQPHIKAVARFLATLNHSQCSSLENLLKEPVLQFSFDFT